MSVAEALEEAHRHGVYHRDLKPHNVVIPEDGRPRVIDFGLAQLARVSEASDIPVSSLATVLAPEAAAPTIAGTPGYMAPEQWTHGECTGAVDVWALGVMLFELCTGTLPFSAPTLMQLAITVCGDAPSPTVRAHSADIPPEVDALIAACMAKQPEARPTASAVVLQLRSLVQPATSSLRGTESPYRGLSPFSEEHAGFFFGREAEVGALLERLRHQPVVAVVGPTGAGKSSFVHAGLIPRLREQGRWTMLRMRPGGKPFEALASRILRTSRSNSELSLGADASAVSDLARRLEAVPERVALELRALADRDQCRVLLVVDQLEEVLTMVDDEITRRRFLDGICLGADDPEEPVRVIVTLRDDYLGRMALGPGVSTALGQMTVLRPLELKALRDVLLAPMRVLGFRFEDDALVDAMTAAVRIEPSALPLLQFAALQLWEHRDVERRLLLREVYDRIGGVEGALATHATTVLDGLSPSEREIARVVLLRLVTPERTRRLVSEGDLFGEVNPHTREEVAGVLARLTAARIVAVRRSHQSKGAALLELAHESLIHRWETLGRWLDESRDDLAFTLEIGQAAELWERRGRRAEELWQGDALADALRSRARHPRPLSPLAEAFLEAARRRDEELRRRRRLAL
ncbi:MAG: serine/threonine-protein kinase PknK, partial [Deltaproteobacteria bacterium]|nr:serine/threonine-protein kinase PknK [Deltaproteobacteria bacterium]